MGIYFDYVRRAVYNVDCRQYDGHRGDPSLTTGPRETHRLRRWNAEARGEQPFFTYELPNSARFTDAKIYRPKNKFF